jgi:hypothetical protein
VTSAHRRPSTSSSCMPAVLVWRSALLTTPARLVVVAGGPDRALEALGRRRGRCSSTCRSAIRWWAPGPLPAGRPGGGRGMVPLRLPDAPSSTPLRCRRPPALAVRAGGGVHDPEAVHARRPLRWPVRRPPAAAGCPARPRSATSTPSCARRRSPSSSGPTSSCAWIPAGIEGARLWPASWIGRSARGRWRGARSHRLHALGTPACLRTVAIELRDGPESADATVDGAGGGPTRVVSGGHPSRGCSAIRATPPPALSSPSSPWRGRVWGSPRAVAGGVILHARATSSGTAP